MSKEFEIDPKYTIPVFAPGSHVILMGEIEATVVSVTVGENRSVQYEVAWLSGLERKIASVGAAEVSYAEISGMIALGFGEQEEKT